jgi:hypothetical protein
MCVFLIFILWLYSSIFVCIPIIYIYIYIYINYKLFLLKLITSLLQILHRIQEILQLIRKGFICNIFNYLNNENNMFPNFLFPSPFFFLYYIDLCLYLQCETIKTYRFIRNTFN